MSDLENKLAALSASGKKKVSMLCSSIILFRPSWACFDAYCCRMLLSKTTILSDRYQVHRTGKGLTKTSPQVRPKAYCDAPNMLSFSPEQLLMIMSSCFHHQNPATAQDPYGNPITCRMTVRRIRPMKLSVLS